MCISAVQRIQTGTVNLYLVFQQKYLPILSRGEWLCSLANIKEANKYFKTNVGRSTTVQSLLFLAHWLCMSFIIKTCLLVRCPVMISSNELLFCAQSGSKRRTRTYNKELRRVSQPLSSINFDLPHHRKIFDVILFHWKFFWDLWKISILSCIYLPHPISRNM